MNTNDIMQLGRGESVLSFTMRLLDIGIEPRQYELLKAQYRNANISDENLAAILHICAKHLNGQQLVNILTSIGKYERRSIELVNANKELRQKLKVKSTTQSSRKQWKDKDYFQLLNTATAKSLDELIALTEAIKKYHKNLIKKNLATGLLAEVLMKDTTVAARVPFAQLQDYIAQHSDILFNFKTVATTKGTITEETVLLRLLRYAESLNTLETIKMIVELPTAAAKHIHRHGEVYADMAELLLLHGDYDVLGAHEIIQLRNYIAEQFQEDNARCKLLCGMILVHLLAPAAKDNPHSRYYYNLQKANKIVSVLGDNVLRQAAAIDKDIVGEVLRRDRALYNYVECDIANGLDAIRHLRAIAAECVALQSLLDFVEARN